MLDHLGQNISAWRELVGFTQADVEDKTGISRSTYSLIESGRAKPSSEHIEKIAKAFHIGITDLVSPPRIALANVRFRSSKPLKSRQEILAYVCRELSSYSELESLVGEVQSLETIEIISREISKQGDMCPESAAKIARAFLRLDDNNKQEIIRDMCGLLEERANVKVLKVNLANPDFFGLSVRDSQIGSAIVVNTWDRISVERQIFTLAHELGHLLMHADDYNPAKKLEEDARENEANGFAGYFQMPTALFEKEFSEAIGLSLFDKVLKVKKIFRVSYKTVLYRLSDRYGKKDIWRSFYAESKRRLGKTLSKTEEPFACTRIKSEEYEELRSHDFCPDRRNRLVIRAIRENRISFSRAAELLGLGLKEFRTFLSNAEKYSLE